MVRLPLTARTDTPESRAFARDEKHQAQHIDLAVKEWLRLLKSVVPPMAKAVKKALPKDEDKQKREMIRLLKASPRVQEYLTKFFGSDDMATPWAKPDGFRQAVMYTLRDVGLSPDKADAGMRAVRMYAGKGFQTIQMAGSQSALRQTLPESIRKWLPRNIVVEVDPNGTIKKVTDRFLNEFDTMGTKIQTQHELVKKYNNIVKRVKKDLASRDEMIRLCALVTAIIMETGIRPGNEGNAAIKTVGGDKVAVETFGATTLGPSHVRFLRSEYAELEFIGKKGTINLASLSDPQIIGLLQKQVEAVQRGGGNLIFVAEDGRKVGYTELVKYFRHALGDFSPTDFRKLRATEKVLSVLREQEFALRTRLQEFRTMEVADLKERVAEEISKVLEQALTTAQQALSHESVDVTIAQYVNPEVILRFLSQSGADANISAAVLGAKPVLQFNPMAFVQEIPQMQAAASTIRVARRHLLARKTQNYNTLKKALNDFTEAALNIEYRRRAGSAEQFMAASRALLPLLDIQIEDLALRRGEELGDGGGDMADIFKRVGNFRKIVEKAAKLTEPDAIKAFLDSEKTKSKSAYEKFNEYERTILGIVNHFDAEYEDTLVVDDYVVALFTAPDDEWTPRAIDTAKLVLGKTGDLLRAKGMGKAAKGHVQAVPSSRLTGALRGRSGVLANYTPSMDVIRVALGGTDRTAIFKTFVHETGHRMYFRFLGSQARAFWKEFFDSNVGPVAADNLIELWEKRVAEKPSDNYRPSLSDFYGHVRDSGDATLLMWLRILADKLDLKDETRGYDLKKGVPTALDQLRAKKGEAKSFLHPVTAYSATNPEELFAEAFSYYLVEGPRRVPEILRYALSAVLPQVSA